MSPLARACIRLVELYQRGLGSRALLVYMKEAIATHGAWRGLRLGVARLRRCTDRDLTSRLFDPVPGHHGR
jgi:hypothetical protein